LGAIFNLNKPTVVIYTCLNCVCHDTPKTKRNNELTQLITVITINNCNRY